ncbi:MAG: UPF0149 family protein [Sphingomonas taxi]
MRQLPSRFRRLDAALADLPVEEPMLLSELDGFLTGLLLGPVTIPLDEWMTVVWGLDTDGVPPFEDPLDVQWFVKAVTARRDAIARDLSRGKLQPIIEADERNGDVLWEPWIEGFAAAIALRPEAWEALADDPASAGPWQRLEKILAIARDESDLDSVAINAFHDRAVVELTDTVRHLYAARGVPAVSAPAAAKIGRNDPCPCGSGKKSKHCCH